ncbi:MAG: ribonuclease HII [Bacteroidetes bacterium]|nr:ribonuclease HII [Bacteroidota bacterium]
MAQRTPLAAFFDPNLLEAGCDEAGRGCLAGPVVASAVILPKDFDHPLLHDSKQISEKQRDILRPIIESEALAWAVSVVPVEEIDAINILQASYTAMHRAVKSLKSRPELLLIDGNRFRPYPEIPHECIIKGDGKFKSIAAASILAKTHRDEIMYNLDADFPHYGWAKNKGYPTASHRDAIRQHGASRHHRRSFRLLPEVVQGELFK